MPRRSEAEVDALRNALKDRRYLESARDRMRFEEGWWARTEAEPLPGPQPGVMHGIDRSFYDLVVNERDYERARVDRLQEIVEAREQIHAEVERVARQVLERLGFSWEPDRSPLSALRKLGNEIDLLRRNAAPRCKNCGQRMTNPPECQACGAILSTT